MLFITNRAIKQSLESEPNRRIDFDFENCTPQHSVFFCERTGPSEYVEILGRNLMARLKASKTKQILVVFHGFNCLPEPTVFPRAERLQVRINEILGPHEVTVVPFIWPCDDDLGIAKDYFDDEKAADMSAFAVDRLLEMFMRWQAEQMEAEDPCYKRINLLAHSMGNRVLRGGLERWRKYRGGPGIPLIFRNTFLVAADIVNESLDRDGSGVGICESSRNVVVYYASDDLALRASKVANIAKRVVSRRLGHTGPEDMSKTPGNVYAVDCDDFNNDFDHPCGHTYFIEKHDGSKVSPALLHMCDAMKTGRVNADRDRRARLEIAPGSDGRFF